MELRRITDQGDETLAEYFAAMDNRQPRDVSRRFAEDMITLIRYLEQEIEAPSMWATTSHHWFYMSDVDHWDPWKARVFIFPAEGGFEIRYRSAPELNWQSSFITLEACSVPEAGQHVKTALRLALADPPGRFKQR